MLTLITVVIGLAGAIAGIFGMNFDTPLAKTGLWGFLVTVMVMATLSVAVFMIARARKWL
ncbi:hypothetical protein SPAN111604_15245 [Sphingomonas antarctica]|uniref:hypothetical protein n=1 Tax=Sphingomonas antarctica TaxID=2040274 RepID=UPI0039E9C511